MTSSAVPAFVVAASGIRPRNAEMHPTGAERPTGRTRPLSMEAEA